MSNLSRSKAWMLGPKAENEQSFEKLLLSAVQDYCHWRKNFHPEDKAYVATKDRLDHDHVEYMHILEDRLFEMLSHLKRSVPWFNARYLGHMNTDQLLAALIGYFSGMLYNQNNIIEEAGTITLQLEFEAVQMMAEMVGIPLEKGWGHLCSGGTAANIEGLWAARNSRFFPYQIALISEDSRVSETHRKSINDMQVGNLGKFGDVFERGQLNRLDVAGVCELRARVKALCGNSPDLAKRMDELSLVNLGIAEFFQKCRKDLNERFPSRFKILLSRNAHYSLKKAVGVLGLSADDVIPISLDRNMRLDTSELAKNIKKCAEEKQAVLAVIGVYGSTEEGSIDDLGRILELRRNLLSTSVGSFWVHADACYGGYALSMIRPEPINEKGLPEPSGEQFIAYMVRIFQDAGNRAASSDIVWKSAAANDWVRRALEVRNCDSISIDPHKLGYLPYPAGAILYANRDVREFIRYDAPYLNAAPSEPTHQPKTDEGESRVSWHTKYMGNYTLEGSRPGAMATSLWLAHKTVPLNQTGHGYIVGRSILGARHLWATLEKEINSGDPDKDSVRIAFLYPDPDLNILCYTFPTRRNGRSIGLASLNRTVNRLYERLLPTEEQPALSRDFIISKTDLKKEQYGELLGKIIKDMGIEGSLISGPSRNPWRDDDKLNVVRTVVMGPFLLDAATRPKFADEIPLDLSKSYAAFLRKKVSETIDEILNESIPEPDKPELKEDVLVLEDDLITQNALVSQLNGGGFICPEGGKVHVADNYADAVKQGRGRMVCAALVDINLRGDENGFDFVKAMAKETYFRGAVIFTGRGQEASQQFEELKKECPNLKLSFCSKPNPLGGRFQEAANLVLEQLWDVLHSPRNQG
jgi:glutamate/tyrosine decarboxylase-like PLP-dependent enzyme